MHGSISPKHPKALHRRGAALMKQGEFARARADLQAACRAAPDRRGAMQLLRECEGAVRVERQQEREYAARMLAPPTDAARAGSGQQEEAAPAARWWHIARRAGAVRPRGGTARARNLLVVAAPLVAVVQASTVGSAASLFAGVAWYLVGS